MLGTPVRDGGRDTGVPGDFSQFGLQENDRLIDQAAGLSQKQSDDIGLERYATIEELQVKGLAPRPTSRLAPRRRPP